MKKFISQETLVATLDRANVDTDAIIPKQYLKSIKRTGFGISLFDDWRYLDKSKPDSDHSLRRIDPNFSLNHSRFKGAGILLTKDNFGCGSSREHAVWALAEYGFKAIIAPSFADIFFNNCFKNGLLPIILNHKEVTELFQQCAKNIGYQLTIDLKNQRVVTPNNTVFDFEIDKFRKYRLLNGLDDIDLTLQSSDEIKLYEDNRQQQKPWLFNDLVRN